MSTRAVVLALVGLWTIPGLPTCMNVYRTDVERMCDAEHRSGKTVRADAAGLMAWVQRNVTSAQGVVLQGELAAETFRDRAVHLRTEARNQHFTACPLADAFDAFAVDDEYRTAVVALCDGEVMTEGGSVARLDVTPADDAERMREIREWTVTNLKGAQALAFVDRLAQSSVQGRPAVLRAEASRLALSSCALAATLERPPPSPLAENYVALPSFTVTRVDAPGKLQEAVVGALSFNGAQTVGTCYGQALVKTPALAGSVGLRFILDGKGKVSKVEETSSSLGNAAAVKCITAGLVGTQLISSQEKNVGTKYSATLVLAPVKGIAPPGWPSVMPTALSPSVGSALDAGAPDAGPPDAGKKKKGVR
jgi:hypothetical protein